LCISMLHHSNFHSYHCYSQLAHLVTCLWLHVIAVWITLQEKSFWALKKMLFLSSFHCLLKSMIFSPICVQTNPEIFEIFFSALLENN
jgi:hypothetical protein